MVDTPQDAAPDVNEIAKAKVISIRTRREVPPEELEVLEQELGGKEQGTPVDLDTAEMVENFADMVQDGRYAGALIVGWNPNDKCFFSDLVLPNDDHADLSAMKLIGQLEMIKGMLMEIIQSETVVEME
ncbi:hypothetical protein [Shinella zoogloeoides]|uniref:hypothetical protein n=1 Tax=Shinella zoogloeoides TaxID=352475 RepID=UPI00273DB3C8|nr:hypothetical protein [Shinella zoogloeoides]WLR90983.1 hypothetical protein Q9316_00105 [Shinella zoogloeoides]